MYVDRMHQEVHRSNRLVPSESQASLGLYKGGHFRQEFTPTSKDALPLLVSDNMTLNLTSMERQGNGLSLLNMNHPMRTFLP